MGPVIDNDAADQLQEAFLDLIEQGRPRRSARSTGKSTPTALPDARR